MDGQPTEAWVVGAINPLRRGASVLVPVLSDRPGGNRHFVQVLDADDRVIGFRLTDVEGLDRTLRDDNLGVSIGEEALWGVTFPGGDSRLGSRSEIAEQVMDRASEFEEQLLTLLSIGRVLWDQQTLLGCLRNAWRSLRDNNPSGAETWRRTVAVPASLRAAIETDLRQAGLAFDHRDLAHISFDADEARPRVTLPSRLYDLILNAGLSAAFAKEAAALAGAVDLPPPTLDREGDAVPVRVAKALVGDEFPATIWGIGKQAAELARLMSQPGASSLPDHVAYSAESHFGEPAFPAALSNVQVVPYRDPHQLVSRATPLLAGRSVAAETPTEHYGLIVFGPEPQAAEAAELLALYLQTEGVPAIGVMLTLPTGEPSSIALGAEPRARWPLVFLMGELGRLPNGGAPTVAALLMLLRAVARPSEVFDKLVLGPDEGHAHVASVALQENDHPEKAVGRCLARLRSADILWPDDTRVVVLLQHPGPAQPPGDYAQAVSSTLIRRPYVASTLLLVATSEPRLTVAAFDLVAQPLFDVVFERTCREIFEDLGCYVVIERDSEFDFVAFAPGFRLLVETRMASSVSPDLVRAMSSRADGEGRRILLTLAAPMSASMRAEADNVEVVVYRDIDRLEQILLEEYAKIFERLRSSQGAELDTLLQGYSYYVFSACAVYVPDYAPQEVKVLTLTWNADLQSARIRGRVIYDYAGGQVLMGTFEVARNGPGPVQIEGLDSLGPATPRAGAKR